MGTVKTFIGNIKGAPGKTAYQYALDAGYTGTEEDFAEKLNEGAVESYSKEEADAKFLTTESDPTVPAWAKAAKKPTYTAEEVGADERGAAAAMLTEGKGYVDASISSNITTHNTDTAAHADFRLELQALADRVNAALDSDDETLDELSEIVAYIKSNKTLIDAITTSKVSVVDIVDNLVTNVTNRPLSAAQGVALKALIDTLTTTVNGKAASAELTAHINNKDNPHGVTAAQIGAASASEFATLRSEFDALAASAVSVLSGADAPTADIGEDGDIYLVTEG